jgi:hypothetical protein
MRRLVLISLCFLALLIPSNTHAWFFSLQCPLFGACRWDNSLAGPFRIATVNFPNASDSWWRLIEAVNQHDGYPGSDLTVTYLNDGSLQVGDWISNTDSLSHVIYADIDSTGGTDCNFDSSFHMTACDIMFDPYAQVWGVSQPSSSVLYDGAAFDDYVDSHTKSLMSAMAHELGHAMGLGHPVASALDQSYSLATMAKADRWPYPDLYPAVPLRPDDGAGLRAMYPGSGETINVSIAHYFPDYADSTEGGYYIESDYDDLYPNGSAPYAEFSNPAAGGAPACPGDSIAVTKTLMNSGTQTATKVGMGYYLSSDPTIDPAGDILIEKNKFTLSAEDWMRNTINLTLPYAPAGTYYIGGLIDPDAAYEVSNRTDNTLIFGTVEILATGLGQPCGMVISGHLINAGADFSVRNARVAFDRTLRASSGVYDITVTGVSVIQATDAQPPQKGMPYTVYTAIVNSTLFGPSRTTLSIRQRGGAVKVNGVVQWGVLNSEAKLLEVGRRYIVFRGSNDNQAFATGGGEAVLKIKSMAGSTQVTTYEELPIVGFDGTTNTFKVRPDYFAFIRSSSFTETRADGSNASRPVDLSALDATPMTLAAFKAALAQVRAEGDYTPLQFQARPMTSFSRVASPAKIR